VIVILAEGDRGRVGLRGGHGDDDDDGDDDDKVFGWLQGTRRRRMAAM
jgi:hypothetical protein